MKIDYKIVERIKNIPFNMNHLKMKGFFFKIFDKVDMMDSMIFLAYKEGLKDGKKFAKSQKGVKKE